MRDEGSVRRAKVGDGAARLRLVPFCASVVVGLFASAASVRADDPPAVALVKQIPGMEAKVIEAIAAVDQAKLQDADEDCEDGKVAECRLKIAAAWVAAVDEAVGPLLEEQASEILKPKADDGSALSALMVPLAKRKERVAADLATEAEKFAKALKEASRPLKEWLELEDVKSLPESFSRAVKAGLADSDKAIVSAFAPAKDAALHAQLAEARKSLIKASEDEYSRSITCEWSNDVALAGKRLTCLKSLLVSGEEVSDIYIKGLPKGRKLTVIALLSESGSEWRTSKGGDDADLCSETAKTGICGPERTKTDYDQVVIESSDVQPVVVEIHTDRLFSPTYERESIFERRKPGFWAAVMTKLRSDKSLVLLTRGKASRVYLAIQQEGSSEVEVASIEIGYARWKFEAGGFLAASNLVDDKLFTHESPDDPAIVVVDAIDQSDNYAIETGVLANFIPQNYQAIGFALGFATNDARAQSMYLGVNLRLRTFGQRGLASIGAGAIMRSVTRFPHLGEGDEIAADSDLLRGSNKFEIGWALIVNLGFGFGSITGVKSESK